MNQAYPSSVSKLKGQFILTAEDKVVPEGWDSQSYQEWKLFTAALPVTPVRNKENEWLGWCIGYPIVDGALLPNKIILSTDSATENDGIENFYYRTSGRWALVLLSENRLYLDAYGSLAAVYSSVERTVASTPTLAGSEDDWDKEFIQDLGFPYKTNWLPFGLTLKKNVQRLLPNHCLNLKTWEATRHWPTAETNFAIERDVTMASERIIDNAKRTIGAVVKDHKIYLSLTAGKDSRMLLSCARDYLDDCNFFTFEANATSIDSTVSKAIAKKFGLKHQILPVIEATPAQLDEWLVLTGRTVATSIWKIHQTIRTLDPKAVLLPGMAGEVGRGHYWKYSDRRNKKIDARDLLRRLHLPMHSRLVAAAEKWLSSVDFLDTFTILDLVYIEQRLGCWAANPHYGNVHSSFEIAPLNSRVIFHEFMRLPVDHRFKQNFPVTIIKNSWPELLKVPFNRQIGSRAHLSPSSIKKTLKTTAKRLVFFKFNLFRVFSN